MNLLWQHAQQGFYTPLRILPTLLVLYFPLQPPPHLSATKILAVRSMGGSQLTLHSTAICTVVHTSTSRTDPTMVIFPLQPTLLSPPHCKPCMLCRCCEPTNPLLSTMYIADTLACPHSGPKRPPQWVADNMPKLHGCEHVSIFQACNLLN